MTTVDDAPFDYGPLQTYEITWRHTGHVERIRAHRVTWPQQGHALFGGNLAILAASRGPSQVHFHGQIAGKWRLVLVADEADLQTVRLVTDGESIPADAMDGELP